MEIFLGRGTLKCGDETITGQAKIEASDDGRIKTEFKCDTPPLSLVSWDGEWVQLDVELEDGAIRVDRAFVNQAGNTILATIPNMTITIPKSGLKTDRYAYRLVNCLYAIGSHLTPNGRGGGAWDAIELNVDGIILRSTKRKSYQQIIETAKERDEAAVTADLLISGAKGKEEANALATAFCDLFSFATKNSVKWISCESASMSASDFHIFRMFAFSRR